MKIQEMLSELKSVDTKGNLIIPKEYLRKFMIMNILIMQEKQRIDQKEIFSYIKDSGFEIPGAWDSLDATKQEKFLSNFEELLNLMKKF